MLCFHCTVLDSYSEEPQLEIRIFEGAGKGTPMTISNDLEQELSRHKDCIGELETNITWFHFDDEQWVFRTSKNLSAANGDDGRATLYLFCASAAKTSHIEVKVRVLSRPVLCSLSSSFQRCQLSPPPEFPILFEDYWIFIPLNIFHSEILRKES